MFENVAFDAGALGIFFCCHLVLRRYAIEMAFGLPNHPLANGICAPNTPLKLCFKPPEVCMNGNFFDSQN